MTLSRLVLIFGFAAVSVVFWDVTFGKLIKLRGRTKAGKYKVKLKGRDRERNKVGKL